MNRKRQAFSQTIVSSRLIFSVAVIAALFVAVASTTAFASGPQGQFEKTLQVNGPVDLEVLTHSGNITDPWRKLRLGFHSRQDFCW